MKNKIFLSLVMILGITSVSISETITFDSQPGNEWYVDRYDPAVFESTAFDGDNRLHLGLRAEDNESNRQGTSYASDFYNYQGRKINTPNNGVNTYVSIDMYLDSTWISGTRAGMWATASNGNNSFPIIEFVVAGDTTEYGSENFTGIRRWQSGLGWTEGISMSADNAWHNLKIEITDTSINYYFDEVQFGTADNLGADSIDNVILQGHNQGMAGEYDIYFDNFTHSVPEPATMCLLGLGGLGLLRRKKRA